MIWHTAFQSDCHNLPRSKTAAEFGPTNMATAPAPPVHLAGPVAYTAISPHTTSAYLPVT